MDVPTVPNATTPARLVELTTVPTAALGLEIEVAIYSDGSIALDQNHNEVVILADQFAEIRRALAEAASAGDASQHHNAGARNA